MLTLGIETSCDETAVSLVEDGRILSSIISSSVHLHAAYGGVVPEIASRYHVEYIYPVLRKALIDADRVLKNIDLVAVTSNPGLPGSLIVGKAFARAVSFAAGVPLVEVDHIHAHIFSSFIDREERAFLEVAFPFVGAVISGGHTSIYICKSFNDISAIGRTRDDAAGEAFDKVAKIMGLDYPGGPIVESKASIYRGKDEILFPRALLKDRTDLDFSFSGIKTAVLYYWRDSDKGEATIEKICFSFQEAVIDVIISKLKRALEHTGLNKLAIGGGVVNNKELRRKITQFSNEQNVDLFLPKKEYCADNAAMVATLGEELYKGS